MNRSGWHSSNSWECLCWSFLGWSNVRFVLGNQIEWVIMLICRGILKVVIHVMRATQTCSQFIAAHRIEFILFGMAIVRKSPVLVVFLSRVIPMRMSPPQMLRNRRLGCVFSQEKGDHHPILMRKNHLSQVALGVHRPTLRSRSHLVRAVLEVQKCWPVMPVQNHLETDLHLQCA